MIDDKIKIVIQNLLTKRNQHRDLKKDLNKEKKKAFDAVDQLQDLLKARKELTAQVKDLQDSLEQEFNGEEFSQELREKIVLMEEEIEQERGKLFELIDKLGKNQPFEMKVELEDGSYANMQMIPSPRVFINGKEEKSD